MAKRWSKEDMLAKHQDRVAANAMRKDPTQHMKFTTTVVNQPSAGNHVRCMEDQRNFQTQIISSRHGTVLEIDTWVCNRFNMQEQGDEPEHWITIRMYSNRGQGSDPLWMNSASKFVLYEGPMNAGKAGEARQKFAEDLVEKLSHHMLPSVTPDDPFYMDEEEEPVAWDDRW